MMMFAIIVSPGDSQGSFSVKQLAAKPLCTVLCNLVDAVEK